MTSAVGNRSTHAITTPTTRRSIQDLWLVGFLISQPVFFAHITSYHTHSHTHTQVSDLGWARLPSYFGFLRRPSNQFTYFSTDLLPIFISYNFVFCFFILFLLYTNYSKKSLRFGFPGESLWLNLIVFVFLLLLRLLLSLYLVVVVAEIAVVVVGLRRCPNSQL